MSIKSLGDTSLARLVDNFRTRVNSITTRVSAMEGKTPTIPYSVGKIYVDNSYIPTNQDQFVTWWVNLKNYINISAVVSMEEMFYSCFNLPSVDFTGCNLSSVTSMVSMFFDCRKLTLVDFSGCNLSKVTRMIVMFRECPNLTLVDFSGCNLSKVTDMREMLAGCTNLISADFSDCDLSLVTNIDWLFYSCRNLTSVDFTGCNLSSVSNVDSTFKNCTSLNSLKWGGAISSTPLDLTYTKLTPAAAEVFFNSVSAKTSSGTITIQMPAVATGADTSGITAKGYTVTFATSLPGYNYSDSITSVDFTGYNLSAVTSMVSMFNGCANLTSVDFSGCDLSNVTSMSYMFSSCYNLPLVDFSNYDLSTLTNMSSMFSSCYNLTSVDFSGCDLSNVTSMSYMFSYCYNLTSLKWGGSVSMSSLDLTYTKLTPAAAEVFFNSISAKTISGTVTIQMPSTASGADTSGITAKGYTVTFATSLPNYRNNFYITSMDFTGCNLSAVTSMNSIFQNCTKLTSVDFSDCDLSAVTDMSSMFNSCSKLTSVDFTGCNLSTLTSIGSMFQNCSNLTSVDFTGCDLSAVTSMYNMFYNCSSLTSLKWGGAISGTPLDLTKTKLTPAAAEAFFNSVSTKTSSATITIRMPVTATGADTSGITAKGYTVIFATS